MPKVKSKTKDHFDKVDDTKVKCKLCQKILSVTGGGTSNMLAHLTRMHPQTNQDTTNKTVPNNPHPISNSMPSSSTTITLKQSTLQVNTYSKKNVVKIDEKLTLMIATDFQPFSMVEDSGFKNFVEALCPDYKIPDKRKIRYEIMPRLYKSASAKLKDILNEVDNLSLTSDLWTSRNMEAFLTVTAHFFYNGLLRSCVLNTTAMPESHTAENLAEKIKAISSEWGIEDKIIAMVTDNAANMIKMCRLLGIRHMPCFAHTMNLVVQDSLDYLPMQELTKKCKNIVKFFRKSTVGAQALKNEQLVRNPEKTPLKLLQEVPTRWNSCFYMFKRILELSEYLPIVQRRFPQAPDILSVDEENMLKDAVAILNIFEQATKMISGDHYATCSLIIPIIRGFYENFTEIQENIKTSSGNGLFSRIRENTSARLLEYETRTACRIATYLHPFFRDSFRQFENKQAAKDAVRAELKNKFRAENVIDDELFQSGPSSLQNEASCSDQLPQLFKYLQRKEAPTRPQTDASAINLIKMYAETSFAGEHTSNVMKDFWMHFHHLKPMDFIAQKYLSIPATSVPSERVFSATGYIINDRRSSLMPEAVEMLCFLNQNQWLLD